MSDDLINDATERLAAVRNLLDQRKITPSLTDALEKLTSLEWDALDAIVAAMAVDRARTIRDSNVPRLTYREANEYMKDVVGDKFLEEIKIVRGVTESELRRRRKSAEKRLRMMSGTRNGTIPITRSGDLVREWHSTLQWINRMIERTSSSDFEDRVEAASKRLDGLIILLTNSMSKKVVPESTYYYSISLAAGNLTASHK